MDHHYDVGGSGTARAARDGLVVALLLGEEALELGSQLVRAR